MSDDLETVRAHVDDIRKEVQRKELRSLAEIEAMLDDLEAGLGEGRYKHSPELERRLHRLKKLARKAEKDNVRVKHDLKGLKLSLAELRRL